MQKWLRLLLDEGNVHFSACDVNRNMQSKGETV